MDRADGQIAEWRSYITAAPAIGNRDVDELEAHLRDQMNELQVSGLSAEEAFLIAVKRMGDVDSLSREFAREHSGRLWKQLVLTSEEVPNSSSTSLGEAFLFAAAAAVVVQLARFDTAFSGGERGWLMRNVSLLVLPFLAAYFARRRQLDAARCFLAASPFVAAALVVNLYPWADDSATEVLVALHLPVVLWFTVAYPYMDGRLGSHERRMDFVRFTGEWVIYYTLIALGGGVLMALTGLVLEPLGDDIGERVIEWVLPSGAAGAVIIAAWLVESKQHVVENMAPVLTTLFSPLFALMLTIAAITYAVTGIASDFDRELLGVFDALMVVVLGLVLYAMSARDPSQPAIFMDRVQLVAVASALVLDLLVLGSMITRVEDLGFTPNRVAALGLNLVLLVNLSGAAWLSVRYLKKEVPFFRLERWQTSYLPVFAVWTTAVVALVPLIFAFD